MRDSTVVSTLCATHTEGETSGGDVVSGCANYTTKVLSRSDITKTAVDFAGFRPPTPYSVTETSHSPYFGTMAYERLITNTDGSSTKIWWNTSGDSLQAVAFGNRYVDSPPLAPAAKPFPTSLTTAALNQALGRLKDQNVNLAVASAELGRTGAMLRDTAYRLFSAYRATRRGDLGSALGALGHSKAGFTGRWKRGAGRKATANRWLELQYGWLPLMSDLYGVYTEFTEKQEIRTTVTGSAKELSSSIVSSSNGAIYSNVTDFRHDFGVYVRLDYAIDFAALANYARDLGLTNPALVAWELVPWSFVIDWFVTVGAWLSSLDADFGLVFKGGSRTRRYVRSADSSLRFATKTPDSSTSKYTYTESAIAYYRVKTVQRTVYLTSPSGGIYFKNPLSWRHAANAVALLIQSMRIK